MEKRKPIFGLFSVVMPIIASLGIYLGLKADTWAGVGLVMVSLVACPIAGFVLALVALARRERFVFLAVCTLVLSLGLAGFYFLSR